MRSDEELKTLTKRMLDAAPETRFGKMLRAAKVPKLLLLPPPRLIPWKQSQFGVSTPSAQRLLESGVLVWAVRLEGEPRPYESESSSAADEFTIGFRHPKTNTIELRRFETHIIPATEGMTLIFPLLLDLETGDALPWSFFCVDEVATEYEAGLRRRPSPPVDKHPRDRAREEAEKFEQEAMQALQLGEVENALRAFDIAIQNYLEAKENVEARRLFANLGFVFRVLGDQKAAVECVNRALQLGVPAQPNDHAMVSMAGVLDRAGDRRAASLWRTAAESFEHEMPLMRAACFARGIGAQLAHGKLEDEPHALGDARALFEPLARTLTPFEWAGLVGGLGDSAGERGTPFLAQAAWLMVRHPSAYGPSTEPFWQLLVGRMGLPAKLAEAPPPKLMLEEFEELVPDGYWLIPRWRS